MKIYARKEKRNVGDTLTPIILGHFLPDHELEIVDGGQGKLVGIGSLLSHAEAGDVVWGAGAMFGNDNLAEAERIQFLSARGQLTREVIANHGGYCPNITGDPGILVSRIFPPAAQKRFRVGYIPHYVDYPSVGRDFGWPQDRCLIDVFTPLVDFIDRVTSCERIISSSLHGIVIAESYGIPVEWKEWSKNVYGGGFKFRDYLTGTNREPQNAGRFPQIGNLEEIQNKIISSISGIPD